MDGHKGNGNNQPASSHSETKSALSDKPSVSLVSSLQENTILVTIGDKKTRCLVDTGATISCASLAYLEKTGINCAHLKPADIEYITGVGNETHSVLGKLEIPLNISGIKISFDFFILQSLTHPVILGMDFLKFHRVQIDLDKRTVYIHDKLVSACFLKRKTGLARTGKCITIPAGSQMNIEVKVSRRKTGEVVLLEPIPNLESRHLAGAKCLVTVKRGKVPMSILNLTESDINIPGHTVVANVSDIDVNNIQSLDSQSQPQGTTVGAASGGRSENTSSNIEFNVSNESLSPGERSELLQFLKRNEDVFSTSLQNLGRTDLYQHRIETDPNAPPVHLPFYRQAPHIRDETQKLVNEMLKDGIIEPSFSVWNSPVVLVRKKDNTFRFAVDYRKLNKITMSISHPLPRLECVFDTIGQARATIFSTLDLASGFWQIPMDPDTRHKAAFITHDGVYEWTRMPFGLKNAPMTFQMVMGSVLQQLNWKHVLCYIDDILVFSNSFQEHLQHLELVFEKLKGAGLTLKADKCHFAVEKVLYLGHIITKDGVFVDEKKTEKVSQYPTPKSQTEVRSFLGLCNYYRRFVENFSKLATPLNQLLQKDVKFNWTKECEESFQALKNALVTAPMLKYPDMNAPFILSTDASGTALGYILGQKGPDGKEMVVAYGGRSLKPDERKFTVSEQECLAVVDGIKAYKEYLTKHFTVITDHQALKWLNSVKDTSSRLGRWALELQGYDFDIIHKPGRVHMNADALSRRPYDDQVNTGKASIQVCANESLLSHGSAAQSDQNKEYIQVEFTYGSIPQVSSADITDENTIPKTDTGKSIPELQKECRDFKYIYEYLASKTLPEDEKLAHNVVVESSQYALLDGHLYHFYQPRVKGLPASQRLVRQLALPGPCRPDVLKSFHDSHAGGGHLGIQKTFAAIRERYFFPGMYQIISNYVTTCDLCQRMKTDRKRQPPPLTPMPVEDVFSRWHMDILGPLPKVNGYQYILLVVDSFSRWCESFPLETQDAKQVATVLYNEIITRYGAPSCLVSDRGANFMSKLVSALCEMFDITRHHSSSYHPQTNSTCERMNSTLAQTLRMYCNKEQTNWPQYLPSVMMAFRMSPATESTGLSPFHMVFGKEMNLPVDTSLVPKHTMAPDAKAHFDELLERLKIAKEIALSNVKDSQAKSKERFDKKSKEPTFDLHDRVLLRCSKVPTGLSPKLFDRFEGPFYITKVGPNYTYMLRRCSNHKAIKSPINASRLIHYKDPYIMRDLPDVNEEEETDEQEVSIPQNEHPTTAGSDNTTENQAKEQNPPDADNTAQGKTKANPPSSQSDDTYYEVESLLKMKYIRGKKHYLVHWKGNYSDTWEPEEFITEKPKREFHIRRAKQGRRKRKSGYRYFTN